MGADRFLESCRRCNELEQKIIQQNELKEIVVHHKGELMTLSVDEIIKLRERMRDDFALIDGVLAYIVSKCSL